MVDARALEPFDLDGPVLAEPRGFVVRPSAAGGFEACAAALSRLLTRAMDEGLWWATIDLAEPHPNPGFAHLGPDEDGALYTEVAGDYYLPPAAHLDDGQRTALRELGWSDPVPDLSAWLMEIDGTQTFLWSRNCGWQVEVDDDADSITLRARRGWGPDPDLPILDDAELLEAFDGLRTILHWPDAYGTWCDLDDPDDRPTLIG